MFDLDEPTIGSLSDRHGGSDLEKLYLFDLDEPTVASLRSPW